MTELREITIRDLRAFHDAVLALGSVPLGLLEEQVDAWISQRLAS